MGRVGRTGDGGDPGGLGQKPGDGELGHGALLAFGPGADQMGQGHVVFQGFRGELRQGGQAPCGEAAVLVDGAGQEAPPQRAVGDKADAQFPQGREYLGLRFAPQKGVFALHGADGLDGMGPPDGGRAGLGETEVQDLAFPDEVFHRSGHVFHGDLGVHAMLVQQIDVVGTQAPQGTFHGPPDVVGAAVEGRGPAFFDAKTEFGGDDHLVAHRGQRFADPFLTGVGAVDLGRIEEGHTVVICPPDQGDHVLFGIGAAVVSHHGQTAQADGRDLQRAETALRQGVGQLRAFHGGRGGQRCGMGHAAQGRGQKGGRSDGQATGKEAAAGKLVFFRDRIHDIPPSASGCLSCIGRGHGGRKKRSLQLVACFGRWRQTRSDVGRMLMPHHRRPAMRTCIPPQRKVLMGIEKGALFPKRPFSRKKRTVPICPRTGPGPARRPCRWPRPSAGCSRPAGR